MIVYQESYDRHNTFERRLFLNGKTYVQRSLFSEEKGRYLDNDDEDLCGQLCADYSHYPEDIKNDIWDETGMGLQYGYIFNEVIFLYGGTTVDWNVVNIYEWSQDMVKNGAVPSVPATPIPELSDTLYQLSWNHDGSCDETVFFEGKQFSCHYDYDKNKDTSFFRENRMPKSVFWQLAIEYDWFLDLVMSKCHVCRYWVGNGRICDWIGCFLKELKKRA